MDRFEISAILEAYKNGALDMEGALKKLRDFPEADLSFARLDSQRALRTGFPEVVFCQGKSPEHLRAIIQKLLAHPCPVLATRASAEMYEAVKDLSAELHYDPASRIISARLPPAPEKDSPFVLVAAAGTSDYAVAEEAAMTVQAFGLRAARLYDVGVAGLHRLLSKTELLSSASVIIAVAGMEGALASVIAGLVNSPVIAVPSSIGYGANFGGLSALLTMLTSCAAGVSVVNIDNGFGAGYQASVILRQILTAGKAD
ncbi:nickel pincer cofactor biosynthesis protein LarB [Spirochaetota bacterium]